MLDYAIIAALYLVQPMIEAYGGWAAMIVWYWLIGMVKTAALHATRARNLPLSVRIVAILRGPRLWTWFVQQLQMGKRLFRPRRPRADTRAFLALGPLASAASSIYVAFEQRQSLFLGLKTENRSAAFLRVIRGLRAKNTSRAIFSFVILANFLFLASFGTCEDGQIIAVTKQMHAFKQNLQAASDALKIVLFQLESNLHDCRLARWLAFLAIFESPPQRD